MKKNKLDEANNASKNIKKRFGSSAFMSKSNKIYLIAFLSLITLVFLFLITTEILNDLGWWDGRFHINYYYDPTKAENHPAYLNAYYDIPEKDWSIYGLSHDDPLWSKWNTRLIRQPNLFWAITQFTWLTTCLVFLILTIRLMKYQEKFPKQLKWLISHNSLFLVTTLDTIVMVVFWSALFKNFTTNFSPDPVLKTMRMVTTIFVHGVIPIFLLIYTSVFAIHDREVVLLGKKYFIVSSYVGIGYILFYILMAFTWDDPYAPFTQLRDGKGWWQLGAIYGLMMVFIFATFHLNNFIIRKFNKYYINNNTVKQEQDKLINEKWLKKGIRINKKKLN